jgi:PEP-CTERM motif
MRKALIAFTAVVAMVVLGGSTARASQTELTLSSPGALPYDSGPSSLSTLSYSNIDFNGWVVTLTAGSSNAGNTLPFGLDLTSIVLSCAVSSCESNPLTITFSGSGFTEVSNGFDATYTVTMATGDASTTQTAWYDTHNNLLNMGTQIGSALTFGPVALAGSKTGSSTGLVGPSDFSLTIQDVFKANPSGASFISANSNVSAAPEPWTMLLFGSGLFLIGAFVRRQSQHQLHA